jgi:hypothetical protein
MKTGINKIIIMLSFLTFSSCKNYDYIDGKFYYKYDEQPGYKCAKQTKNIVVDTVLWGPGPYYQIVDTIKK